jgi:hypothetical protein
MAGRLGTSGRKDDPSEQKDGTLGHEHNRSRWPIVSDQRARDPFGPRLFFVRGAPYFGAGLSPAADHGITEWPARSGNQLGQQQSD